MQRDHSVPMTEGSSDSIMALCVMNRFVFVGRKQVDMHIAMQPLGFRKGFRFVLLGIVTTSFCRHYTSSKLLTKSFQK
jgi:hypothetical protein